MSKHSEIREAKLFRNNRNQAVRIPVEFELPGDKVTIRRDGNKLIIEPMRTHGLLGLLSTWEHEEDGLPEIKDAPIKPEDIF